MKKINLLVLMVILATGTSMAQLTYKGGADVLGAHNGYGRGCVMCHAPHSGSAGNGQGISTDPQNGMTALWGESLTPLYGKTLNFGGGGYPVTLPSMATSTTTGGVTTWSSGVNTAGLETTVLLCLSCHDGVSTTVAMMQNQTVEPLPIAGGNAPTLLATAAPAAGAAYNNDHPVGGSATVGCNGSVGGGPSTTSSESGHNWDCIGGGTGTTPITPGPNQKVFMTNYPGSFWNKGGNPLSTAANGNVNAVGCTTCHNQHSMTAYTNGKTYTGGASPSTVFPTMFFIKGWYNPTSNGNSVAQFCRNCHGGESNEMQGVLNVPTT
jgi:hypothetical protein